MVSFFFSCTNYSKYFSTGKYANEKLLYAQKIKGNTTIPTYILKERLNEEPVQKVIFPWYMPTLGIYLQAEKDTLGLIYPYNIERINEKYSVKTQKIERKISELDSSKMSENRYLSKQVKLERKKSQKKIKKNKRIEEGNWAMRALGKAPVLFDYSDVYQNQTELTNYLHSNGFLNASVKTEVHFNHYKAYVTYLIDEQQPFKVSRYRIEGPTELRRLIYQDIRNFNIHPKENLIIENLNKERNRIYRIAKNNGYFEFDKQSIQFEIDTVSIRKSAKIKAIIDTSYAESTSSLQKYYINEVFFILDADKESLTKDTVVYKDMHFIYNDKKFSQKLIYSKTRIRKGNLYSHKDAEETQNQLGGIDVFSFVNINFQKVDSTNLNAFIYASSAKKHQFSTEAGVNINVYANSGEGQGLPGPFVNGSYKNRKVFKGFEILQANISYALAGQININENFRSQEFYANTALLIPKTLGPNPEWRLFRSQTQTTRLNVGYSNIDRVEYQRKTVNGYIGYQFLKGKQRINFSPFDFTFIEASIKDENFREELLKLNQSILESFESSIISSSSIVYTFDDNDITKNRRSRFIRISLESGGTYLNFINIPEERLNGYSTFTYWKAQWDYRYKKPISSEGAFAYRLNLGIAKTTGNTSSLPYTKYFFIGGLNSNRAWPARRLGPGSYAQTNDDGEFTYENEQPGEIIIESSLELRENIIGVLDGAVFMDIGNIWTIQEGTEKEGAKFEGKDFISELAVGTGLGLRLDFSFLILRFDIGLKTWDPAQEYGSRLFPSENRFAYNFGIGYPF